MTQNQFIISLYRITSSRDRNSFISLLLLLLSSSSLIQICTWIAVYILKRFIFQMRLANNNQFLFAILFYSHILGLPQREWIFRCYILYVQLKIDLNEAPNGNKITLPKEMKTSYCLVSGIFYQFLFFFLF